VGGRGRGGKKTTPDLALGFALDIKLLDAKGQNTCNINTATPWDIMATRARHSTEFSEFFLYSNSGLVHTPAPCLLHPTRSEICTTQQQQPIFNTQMMHKSLA
jgi:hypothetical protein